MIEYEKLYNEVKNNLSEKRFNHSLAVVKRATEYARSISRRPRKSKISSHSP